eukprot:CAMPEP_0185723920 /NCGR_PEP_ID=MMETSP1171-20130828/589_1 /TAXON_ID=374046 /ORGANISM="Helicotheca tamensis, Strain CCMP826" /LENGTH=506 /DNA_ID=CAMNT_0028391689 /DNA_START=51 /DNA_END=1571 /DNA_ORIENTATION=+
MSLLNQFDLPQASNGGPASYLGEDDFVHVMETDSAPTSPALSVKLTPKHETIGLQSEHKGTTQICATVKASNIPEDDSARAPVDIVVVLDVSGSMSGDKLALCKKTLELLLRELRPQDRFGLVTFSCEAVLEIPARKLSEVTKQAALRKIKSLRTRGSTNLSGGIGMGAREMRAVEEPNPVRSIFVLTDGHANCGIRDPKGIVELTKGCLGTSLKTGDDAPITVHTFGYGTSHDSALLQDISQATTGGSYYFVESDSDVASAFGDALGGVLSVVAQNVVLTLSVPPESKLVLVHHEDKTKQEDGSFKVNLGDFYAEESRDVVFHVNLRSDESTDGEGNGIPHAMASLSYLDTIKKELVEGDAATAYIKRPNTATLSPPNPSVVVQWLRIRTTIGIEEADQLSQRGELKSAREKITAQLQELRQESTDANAESDPLIIQLIADLNDVHLGLDSVKTYETFGSKTMKRKFQSHRLQRCNEASECAENTYRSKRKACLSRKMKNRSTKK